MKKSILLIYLAIFLISCSKDGDSLENYIKLPEAINFFSEDFKSASRIIFNNNAGDSLAMNMKYRYKIDQKSVSGNERFVETNEISMSTEQYPFYPILLFAGPLFKQDSDEYWPLLNIHFMANLGLTDEYFLISSLNITNPEVEFPNWKMHEEITLNNKTFTNVYSALRRTDLDAYADFYFSQEIGVVAFSDENNDLWVYDRIVE